jgi:hypothetical protein
MVFPRENTLVVPAINGGQGLIPVNNPAIKGTVFENFFVPHRDFSLSDSLKPVMPQKISKNAINSLDTESTTLECANRIPMLDTSSAMAR